MTGTPLRAFYPLALAAALLLTLAPLTTSDARSMYRWVDEHGNVHYSDQRPSGREADRVGDEPRMAPGQEEPPATADTGTEEDTSEEERQRQQQRYEQRMQEHEEQRQDAEARNREMCEQIRQELARLEQGGRLRAPGEDGQLHYLSEEQRQERIANQQRILEERC